MVGLVLLPINSTLLQLESLIRWTVAARNVFQKRFASIKSPEKVHVQRQLSADPRILAHLKGNVEYGLYWAVNALQAMQAKVFGYSGRFGELAEAFWILAENHEVGAGFLSALAWVFSLSPVSGPITPRLLSAG